MDLYHIGGRIRDTFKEGANKNKLTLHNPLKNKIAPSEKNTAHSS
jgi:hypothetical protein